MNKPLKLSGRMSVVQRIIALFDDEMDVKLTADQFQYVADPKHEDVYAVRLNRGLAEYRDYVVYIAESEIEAGEFEQWPPRTL